MAVGYNPQRVYKLSSRSSVTYTCFRTSETGKAKTPTQGSHLKADYSGSSAKVNRLVSDAAPVVLECELRLAQILFSPDTKPS